ncbi:hypothetical protein BJ741DRAFT_660149 [Chytriomyces cf. hyalinus JEL632]|nr:hypothetical protein BJ741DRAFT_660149 [Chytriomyces cf. hyalinus JEL632]
MFCLDFLTTFAFHYIIKRVNETHTRIDTESALFHYTSASASGLLSALILYPFDLVRIATVPTNQTTFAYSTIPFSTVYLGLYFSNRDATSVESRFQWALTSSLLGVCVELPFDKAKWGMFRNARAGSALLTTGLRVPLAMALLLVYDEFGIGLKRRREEKIEWRFEDVQKWRD